MSRWFPSASVLVAALGVTAFGYPDLVSLLSAALLVVLALAISPLAFPPSTSDAAGRRRAEVEGVPLIYWRPGCSYCIRLRLVLGGTAGRAVWVDVSQDVDASTRVRAVNDGNETVPTVFVGASARTNPSPRWVRGLLTSQ